MRPYWFRNISSLTAMIDKNAPSRFVDMIFFHVSHDKSS